MFRAIYDGDLDAKHPGRRRLKPRVGAIVYTFTVGHDDGIVRRRIASVVNAEYGTVRLEPGCCYECSHVFGPRDYCTTLSESRASFRSYIESNLERARSQAHYWAKRLKTVDSEKVAAAYTPSAPSPPQSLWDLPD
jgi:hypothetical protein